MKDRRALKRLNLLWIGVFLINAIASGLYHRRLAGIQGRPFGTELLWIAFGLLLIVVIVSIVLGHRAEKRGNYRITTIWTLIIATLGPWLAEILLILTN